MKPCFNKYLAFFIPLFLVMASTGCKKYLEAKPDKKLVIPSTIQDVQALLDFSNRLNERDPGAGEISADDYYLTSNDFDILSEDEKRVHTWQPDHLFSSFSNDWSVCYDMAYTANSVLQALVSIERTPANHTAWDNAKGQALFIRGRSFLQLVTLWAKAYDPATASATFGIPLRLTTDFNEPSVRATLQQSYDQVLADLKGSVPLLPLTSIGFYRPSKPAAHALLARTFLFMRDYANGYKYADSCLQLNNKLIDYNSLDITAYFPIPQFNDEIIFETNIPLPVVLDYGLAKIDTILYKLYEENDLRKHILFYDNGNGTYSFQGNYSGYNNLFAGIATDEVYLTRAECNARLGNKDAAMLDLNALIVKRWKTGTFQSFTASDASDALNIILVERRKELLMRGLRWMDIKRLNKEGRNITLQRIINGQTYTLHPNDLRYALPIPEAVIELSGMQQNER